MEESGHKPASQRNASLCPICKKHYSNGTNGMIVIPRPNHGHELHC